MSLEWTSDALEDLARLHDFLIEVNNKAAAKAVLALTAAPERLLEYPRLGERLEQFAPHEIRRIIVGRYELTYEIKGSAISILHVWHTREDR
jgi:plasmid stabilization system protein ParE